MNKAPAINKKVTSTIQENRRYVDRDGSVFVLRQVNLNVWGYVINVVGYWEKSGYWQTMSEIDDEDTSFHDLTLCDIPSNAEKFIGKL